jgi:hypothetical protein
MKSSAAAAYTQACERPGSRTSARIAVATATVAMLPTWMNSVRMAAIVAEWSGAKCRPALRLAGLVMPLPIPTRNAADASQT